MSMIITASPPKVVILGQTAARLTAIAAFAREYGNILNREVADPAIIPVIAGAVCYDSFDNKAGRTNEEYLESSIIDHEHYSVLEHFTYNLGVSHLPRTTLMELTRHRVGVAYSWRSTRFTDSWIEYVMPPNVRNTAESEGFVLAAQANFDLYHEMLQGLGTSGELTRKQRKEAARAILLSSVGTQGMFSPNVRELRHIMLMRTAEGADESFREFGYALWDAVAHHKDAFYPDFVIPEDRSKGISLG